MKGFLLLMAVFIIMGIRFHYVVQKKITII